MSNPTPQVRPIDPIPQPRSVSPGVQPRPLNLGTPIAPNITQPRPNPQSHPPIYTNAPPQATSSYTYPQGILAPPRSQQIYAQPMQPQTLRHPSTHVTSVPQHQVPIYSSIPQYASYPSHHYSPYSSLPQPYTYEPYPAYGIPYANVQPHGQINSLKEPKESERRITYHPYTRYYTDYEQRVTMVPVEKVRTKYYEKIFETNFVPKAIEEHIVEVKPVEKTQMKVEYVPVERKIIHLPQDEKLYQIVNPEKHPELMKRMNEESKVKPFDILAKHQMTSNPSERLISLEQKTNQRYEQKTGKLHKGNFKESHVEEVYSSRNDGTGERDRYTIKVS